MPRVPTTDRNTGRCSVYVCYAEGFHEPLRPAFDSAPTDLATMTPLQVSRLKDMIAQYLERCRIKNGNATP